MPDEPAAAGPGLPEPAPPRRLKIERAAVASILLLAALLRFPGADHHLRRTGPEFDEQNNFLDPIKRMWNKRTADPTVYSGYAGFFNHLAFLPVGVGRRVGGDVGAAVAGRLLVGAFSVLNVLLAYVLCRRLTGGPAPALAAAALLAVSRGEVRAAHYITPDVLVASATLGVLLAVARTGIGTRTTIGAAALCGLAVATKYTGVVAAPALGVALALEGSRSRRLALAAGVGVLTFCLAAPYAVVEAGKGGMGMGFVHALQVYYGQDATGNRTVRGEALSLDSVGDELLLSLGPLAAILALLSPLVFRPVRALLPAIAVAATGIAAMSAANLIYSRHVLPVAAAVVVLAAAGVAGCLALLKEGPRRAVAAVALTIGLVVPPALESVPLAERYVRPAAVDLAGEWVEARLPGRARVATSFSRFGLPDRFEVRSFPSWTEAPADALRQYDLVVTGSPEELQSSAGARLLASFGGSSGIDGRASVLELTRPAVERVAPSEVRASAEDGQAAAAWDGDPATVWPAPEGPVRLTAVWPDAREVVRIELETAGSAASWAQTTSFEGRGADSEEWRPIAAFRLGPVNPTRGRRGSAPEHAWALTPPRRVRGIRILRSRGEASEVVEVRVFAIDRGTGSAKSR